MKNPYEYRISYEYEGFLDNTIWIFSNGIVKTTTENVKKVNYLQSKIS